MKQKLIIVSIIMLVISLFGNLVLSLNLKETINDKNEFKNELEQLELQKEEIEKNMKVEDEFDYLDGNEAERIIELFFKAQYDYDHESYKERFENVRPYVNDDVYGQLTSAGVPDVPSIKFSNVINDIQIYTTEKNDYIDSMILLDTTYTIDGFDNSMMTQIFNVVFKDSVIISLELVGTFTKMAES